jgi:hypothetical protein
MIAPRNTIDLARTSERVSVARRLFGTLRLDGLVTVS